MSSRPTGDCTSPTTKSPPRNSRSRAASEHPSTCSSARWRNNTGMVARLFCVRAVKESGGIILVQDPDEAEFSSMPRSAIATGIADFVLPRRELAQRLTELVREKNDDRPEGGLRGLNADLLQRILAHVRIRTGHDFSKYKRATILRRIKMPSTVFISMFLIEQGLRVSAAPG